MIRDVLADARRRLAAASFAPPTREAGLLLGHLLGWSEARLLAYQDEVLEPTLAARFEQLLERRLRGEPIAYIVGFKEFYGRTFEVDRRVLIPRPETEHLVELALQLPLSAAPTLLDIGTGSGCLACTLGLEIPRSRIVATDISLGALAVAQGNRRRYDLDSRLQLVAGDLAAGIDLATFDLVVSNPPYIGRHEAETLSREILDFEPETALFAGPSGDSIFRRLLLELAGLRPGSWFLVEIGADQEDRIRRASVDSPLRLLEIRSDYAGHPRIALLRRR